MGDSLDLAILDAGPKVSAVVFARCGSDVAVSSLPFGSELDELLAFRLQIDNALLAVGNRPLAKELVKFGKRLFEYVIRDEVKELYTSLPKEKMVRLNILSNRSDLKSLPWEYFQDPTVAPGPWLARSVIRVVPTRRGDPPDPLPLINLNRKLKILFAFADPVDQDPVSWVDVRDSVQRELTARLPADSYEMKVIDANPRDLTEALQNNDGYDIFHYSGHANVDKNGKGYLLLLNRTTQKSIPFDSETLSAVLRNRGIRLVILSACNTSIGSFQNKFDVPAEALVNSGIPAVIANQFPVPDSTVAAFIGQVYRTLLKTGDIDYAVQEGRLTLFTDPALKSGESAVLEWGIPTLYRHIAGSIIFKV